MIVLFDELSMIAKEQFMADCNVLSESVYLRGYGLYERGLRTQFLAGATDSSLLHSVETGSGVQLASHPMSAGNSCQSAAEVRNVWSHTSTPPYVFMA
jgi:hypothetical protein